MQREYKNNASLSSGVLRARGLFIPDSRRRSANSYSIAYRPFSKHRPSHSFLFFPQHDFDKVQILSPTGFHGSAVANRKLILLPQPVRPYFFPGFHLMDFDDLGIPALADHVAPIGHIVHILQLLRRPGQQQFRR